MSDPSGHHLCSAHIDKGTAPNYGATAPIGMLAQATILHA